MTTPTLSNDAMIRKLERDIKEYLGKGGAIKQLPSCTYSDKLKKESMSSIAMRRKLDKDE